MGARKAPKIVEGAEVLTWAATFGSFRPAAVWKIEVTMR